MVHLLQQEVDQIHEMVAEIVKSMSEKKKLQQRSSQPDIMSQLADDLAALGMTATATKPPPAAPEPTQLRVIRQPEQQRVQQVTMQLQHDMMQLEFLILQGRRQGCKELDKVRYNIGYSLGTLVRLFYGPTDLQVHPQALPDAFALALKHAAVPAESSLQLLVAGLSSINMA